MDGAVVYTLSKMGDLFCLDSATGRVIWEQQLHRQLVDDGFACLGVVRLAHACTLLDQQVNPGYGGRFD